MSGHDLTPAAGADRRLTGAVSTPGRQAGRIPRLPRVAGVNVLPASFAQERLWFLTSLSPENPSYNEAFRLRASGDLDLEVLRHCFTMLAERHETLRTTLAMQDGRLVQRIDSRPEVRLHVVDVSALPTVAGENVSLALRRQDQHRPFDLERGPLFRVTVVRLAPDEHVLGFTAHHVAADAWSLAILLRELGELYTARVEGRPPRLPDLPVQYADFAAWQRQQLEDGRLDASVSYWRQELADTPLLRLPVDRRRVRAVQPTAAVLEERLPSSVAARVRALGQRANATLFMTTLASWVVLLWRFSGETDIVVGTPTANRGRAELDHVVGFLGNTVALRCRVDRASTFRQLVERIKERCLAAYAHQDAPFDRVVEQVGAQRVAARNPLFDSVFMVQARPPRTMTLPGVTLSWMTEGPAAPAKFDLVVTVQDEGEVVRVLWRFDPAVLERRTIQSMAESWRSLVEDIVADPDRPLASYSTLSEEARRQVLAGEPARHPATVGLHQLLETCVDRQPHATALVDGDVSVSYRALNERANRIAHRLLRAGVRAEEPVALLLEGGAALVAAIIGVLKAGAVYVPLDPRSPRARLDYLAADVKARVLITERGLRERAPDAVPNVFGVEDDADPRDAGEENPRWRGTPDAAAYIIYTSGSTGSPKGVVVTHANVVRLLRATEASYGFGPGDVWTLFHSCAFDFSVWEIWGSLAYGGTLVVVPHSVRRSPRDLHRLLRRARVTVLNQTPSSFRQLIEADTEAGEKLPALRLVIFGGEELDPQALRGWLDRHGDETPRLENMYGITETTVHVTQRRIRASDVTRGLVSPIGQPIADLKVYVLDEQMRPAPPGATGEMYVGGAGVARGYWRRPGLTAERFVPDPFGPPATRLYRTGDRARWNGDGDLTYLGRIDTQVKIRGHRIELGEIEAAMSCHPAVRQAAVDAREDPAGGRRLVGYFVSAGSVDEASLRSFLRERLPEYMVPAILMELPAIPLTSNGKVNRAALPAMPALSTAPRRDPAMPLEEILGAVWAQALDRPFVATDDNFFDIGGHSLLATQVTSRVRHALGVDVPLRLLFEHPTLSGYASRVAILLRTGGEPEPPIVPRSAPEPVPLSFAQQGLWLLDQLDPGNPAYNVAKAARLSGPLDVGALCGAWREVVRRHEALRTSFPAEDGQPVQRVAPPGPTPLPLVDLTALPAGVRDRAAMRLVVAAAARRFSLGMAPLWRLELLRLAAGEHVLVAVLHHIVCDGWSIPVLVKELTTLYEAFRAGRPSPLSALPVQYADFTAWQRRWLAGAVMESHRTYWRGQLAGSAPLRLPHDFATGDAARRCGGLVAFTVDADVTTALRDVARREGVTVFMVLLAALQLLLARWTRQTDVAVGTDVANRTRSETEGLIGFFVNQLVMRTDVGSAPTFAALLARVREAALGAYAHQDLPFEQLVDDLAPMRDERGSLFPVKLVFQETPGPSLRLADLTVSDLELPSGGAKLDLILLMRSDGACLRGRLEYDATLFARETAALFVEQYTTLLRNACADPAAPLGSISLLSAGHYRQLTAAFS